MMKRGVLLLLLAAVLGGCRSDLYYQDRAVERARKFLLKEKGGELSLAEMNFIRYNTPVLLHAPVLGDISAKGKAEHLSSEFHQICVTWIIPGRKDLYMVFGVSTARMADWQPNRVLVRDYRSHVPLIAAAAAAARSYAQDNLYDQLDDREVSVVRFTFPWLLRTDFGLNFDPKGTLSEAETAKLRAAAGKKIQYSLAWKFGGRALVFAGLADPGFKGWAMNFAGLMSERELAEHTVAQLLTPEEGLKGELPPETPADPAKEGR